VHDQVDAIGLRASQAVFDEPVAAGCCAIGRGPVPPVLVATDGRREIKSRIAVEGIAMIDETGT
jgi:hypothetical protein